MSPSALTRAWLVLLVLSGASTLIAMIVSHGIHGMGETTAGAAILAVALMKSRVILSRYLGLWQAPAWRRGFNLVIGFYCLVLLALYALPNFQG